MSLGDEMRIECEIEASTKWINQKRLIEQYASKGIWHMGNGKPINIKDMTDEHIENCIRYIKRRDTSDLYASYIPIFKAELEARKKATDGGSFFADCNEGFPDGF